MPYHLWMGNIVNIATDAIVNAANTELKRTPGICEAIFAAADSAKLEEACRRHGHCPIGHSVMTPSFGLPARYIIHVAGPGWFGGAERERLLLADCYRRAMTRAVTSGCKSIAFPLIFSGEYHIPREEAIYIAGQAYKRQESCLGCGFGPLQAGNLSDGQTDFGMGRYTQL